MELKGRQASRPGAAMVKALGSTDPLPEAEKPVKSPAEALISVPAENLVERRDAHRSAECRSARWVGGEGIV